VWSVEGALYAPLPLKSGNWVLTYGNDTSVRLWAHEGGGGGGGMLVLAQAHEQRV
jgi:hypothetical protein